MKKWMKRYNVKNYKFIKAFAKDKQSQDIYKNLPLMGSITSTSMHVVNCEEYFVEEFGKGKCIIKETYGDHQITIKTDDISRFFRTSYSISIHRSQGISIRQPYTIWEWGILDERLKYVALSRSTDVKFINLIA